MALQRRDPVDHQQHQVSPQTLSSKAFLDLPAEIHLKVAECLDIPSTCSLRLACRQLYGSLPPVPEDQLTVKIKSAIRKQLQGEKVCGQCGEYRPRGAFPHLVGPPPGNAASPDGSKGWVESVKQARENRQRIGERKALMRRYGLIHRTPCPRSQPSNAGASTDEGSKSTEVAKHIERQLPRGGWVQLPAEAGCDESHLFEYRGFCGWTCQGAGLSSGRWTFRCECRRCSAEVNETQNKCCWCDQTDSRYALLTASPHEKSPCHHCWDQYLSKDLGEIIFKTTEFPYGSETSWVGRRKNTCMKVLHRRGKKWEERELPSWQYSWCGVCSIYQTPKKKQPENLNDPFQWGRARYGRRDCVRHALDPKWGDDVPRASRTSKMRFERFLWWQGDPDGIGEPRAAARPKNK